MRNFIASMVAATALTACGGEVQFNAVDGYDEGQGVGQDTDDAGIGEADANVTPATEACAMLQDIKAKAFATISNAGNGVEEGYPKPGTNLPNPIFQIDGTPVEVQFGILPYPDPTPHKNPNLYQRWAAYWPMGQAVSQDNADGIVMYDDETSASAPITTGLHIDHLEKHNTSINIFEMDKEKGTCRWQTLDNSQTPDQFPTYACCADLAANLRKEIVFHVTEAEKKFEQGQN